MSEESIQDINQRFHDLMQALADISRTVNQLDAIRIQLVYNYTAPDPETREPNDDGLIEIDITPFITECWSKLSVYHGVYCNLGAAYCFKFNDVTINNGDFLIKQPNNTFLKIPGSTPFFYQPQSYDSATGLLTFQLVNTGTAASTVTVPAWQTGNPNGHIFTWSSELASTAIYYGNINIPEAAIKGGRYFVNNEEIIFPPNLITINATIRKIGLPTGVNSCYIPYLED